MSYSRDYDKNARAGIDTDGIRNLCVVVSSYALKLKKSLDDIDDLIDNSSSYFGGDTRDDFVDRFNDIIGKKIRIKENILSYVDDYNVVVSKFKTITFDRMKIENGGK